MAAAHPPVAPKKATVGSAVDMMGRCFMVLVASLDISKVPKVVLKSVVMYRGYSL